MTTNNQGVDTRELALMILLEIERGEKSHIVLRQVLEKYQYLSKQPTQKYVLPPSDAINLAGAS